MATFYVIWSVISVLIVAWFGYDALLVEDRQAKSFSDIGFYLMAVGILATVSLVDYNFCKVVNYYAEVTCKIK